MPSAEKRNDFMLAARARAVFVGSLRMMRCFMDKYRDEYAQVMFAITL